MIPLPSLPKVVFEDRHRAIFEIEGLYPGYGQTIGNSLRRILLSSLEGAVITSIKIEGVGHEFSIIEGVAEDVVNIILNLKQVRFKLHESGSFVVTLAAKGEKKVTAEDFECPSQVEVVNPDVFIATLTSKKASLYVEATVESGLGYVPVEARTHEKVMVGTIALDAAFSPVRHANYEVENMRVADRTDYNRLRLDVETDGSLTPREAFARASAILTNQFDVLAHGFAEGVQGPVAAASWKEESEMREEGREGKREKQKEMLSMKMKLDELRLSSRTLNALREAGLKTVSGLARKRESSLGAIEGIGEKGMQEIKQALEEIGITLKE